jgi:hypothetical protein
LCSINSVPLNAWLHVASTFMKPVMKNYINGILDNSGNINLSIGSSSYDVAVGARHPDDPGEFFVGFIDELRIYSRALSDSEIKALYDATK